jgi:hypothetical protein
MAWWCVSWCSGNSGRLQNCILTALKSQIRLCLRTWTYTKLFLGPCTSLDVFYVLNVNMKTDDVRAPVRRRTRAATWQNSDYNSHSLHRMNFKRAVWWILIRRDVYALTKSFSGRFTNRHMRFLSAETCRSGQYSSLHVLVHIHSSSSVTTVAL